MHYFLPLTPAHAPRIVKRVKSILLSESIGMPARPWPTVQPPASEAEKPKTKPPPASFQIEDPDMLDHENVPCLIVEMKPPSGMPTTKKRSQLNALRLPSAKRSNTSLLPGRTAMPKN